MKATKNQPPVRATKKRPPTGFPKSYQPVHSQSYTLGRVQSSAHSSMFAQPHGTYQLSARALKHSTQEPIHDTQPNYLHSHRHPTHLPTKSYNQPTVKSGPFTTFSSHMHRHLTETAKQLHTQPPNTATKTGIWLQLFTD
jgi:hypothetical protein